MWSAPGIACIRPEQDEKARAEERRLFYVAMTRAMDRLFLTRSAERFLRGAMHALPPSPFWVISPTI
ncbi:3'-5' exonuclease [Chelativorans alearense]|uniref:3'-5' exonuclease n=1 Tax=Chelativorans alearense TaxID=2681495 RepID=UPI0013D35240|nr:3'-5' exonuclease [Chelativorans alearense]